MENRLNKGSCDVYVIMPILPNSSHLKPVDFHLPYLTKSVKHIAATFFLIPRAPPFLQLVCVPPSNGFKWPHELGGGAISSIFPPHERRQRLSVKIITKTVGKEGRRESSFVSLHFLTTSRDKLFRSLLGNLRLWENNQRSFDLILCLLIVLFCPDRSRLPCVPPYRSLHKHRATARAGGNLMIGGSSSRRRLSSLSRTEEELEILPVN